MNPSSFSSSAMRTLSFDDGMSTFSCSALLALRMRVSRSAIGSLRMALPARFHDARHLTLEGQLTEAQATHLELAEIAAGSTAQLAPVIGPRAELGGRLRLHDERGLGHGSCHSLNGMPRPARSARASSSVGAVVTMMMSMPRTLSTLS